MTQTCPFYGHWLLFRVQFPFHCTGITSLYIFRKGNSQRTTVRKHCCTWGRGREAERWRQEQREKFKENNFPATGRAKNRGNYCFSLTCYVGNMDPVTAGGLLKFLSVLQRTVISGIRHSDCFTAITWLLAIVVGYNQWVPSSPQYYYSRMLSNPWTLRWWIPKSHFTFLRGSISPLAFTRVSI